MHDYLIIVWTLAAVAGALAGIVAAVRKLHHDHQDNA